jgi:flagellar hook protein FlgE
MPFQIAVSGIKAASTDLNVIGNNVANANTTGFKQSRAEFADVYAVSNLGVSKNTPGSGVRLAQIAQQFTQGNISITGSTLDLAVNGNGFFALDDGGSRLYTRAGAFGVDRDGYIVNADRKRLVGYQVDANGNVTGSLGPMQLSTADLAPQATSTMNVDVNLDASKAVPTTATFDATDATSYTHSTSTTVYDSLGSSHLATVYFVKTATANTWDVYTYVDNVDVGGPDQLTFTDSGAATGTTSFAKSFTPSGGAAAMNVTLDYTPSTQYGSQFSVNRLQQNGYATGRLVGLDIDESGVISGKFTNGQSNTQGQVALANFANSQGLKPDGNTNWIETYESGSALIAAPGASGLGLVQAGALEDSNVDLSEELVKLIIAQRNFQANTQVIRTADAVTQSIINIR